MIDKANEIGPHSVSKHVGQDGLGVIDIAKSSLNDPQAAMDSLNNNTIVTKVLDENKCLHIEFKTK